MTDPRHISQEELALLAMQVLSSEESAEVRLHLSECATCRDELAAISGDLALVAMSVEQHPLPEGARQRFIEGLSARAAAPVQQQPESRIIPIAPRTSAAKRFSWVPWAAVAALLILSANLFIKVRRLSQRIEVDAMLLRVREAENIRARALLDVLTATNAQRVVLTAGTTPPAPSARATYLPSRGALVLQASNLQPLPLDKTYELWIIPMTGAPIPAGLFRPDPSGSASVVLPDIPRGVPAKAFGITIENATGSSTPTAPIILSGEAATAGE